MKEVSFGIPTATAAGVCSTRSSCRPDGKMKIRRKIQSPQPIVSDERMAELRTQLKKSLKSVEAKQLTLFD